MRTLRCKCGESVMYTSMGVFNCEVCDKCGTTHAGHPDHHAEPEPHTWITRYNQRTGEPYEICDRCLKRKKDIKAT